jgi:hypothetical protein
MDTPAHKSSPFYLATMITFIVIGVVTFISYVYRLYSLIHNMATIAESSDVLFYTFATIVVVMEILLAVATTVLASLALSPIAKGHKTHYFTGIFALRALVGLVAEILSVVSYAFIQTGKEVGSVLLLGFGSATFIIDVVVCGFFIAAFFLAQQKITWQVLMYVALLAILVMYTINSAQAINHEIANEMGGLTLATTITSFVLFDLAYILGLLDVHNQPYELAKSED